MNLEIAELISKLLNVTCANNRGCFSDDEQVAREARIQTGVQSRECIFRSSHLTATEIMIKVIRTVATHRRGNHRQLS